MDAARAGGGRCLLRIEDIDRTRCRRELEDRLHDDLAFLGLRFDGPIRRQSEHLADYEAALRKLDELGVLYPCFCTRAAIAAEIAQAPSAPNGVDADPQSLGPRYPGLCRDLPASEAASRIAAGQSYALRLSVDRALAVVASQHEGGQPLHWHDRSAGRV